MLDVLRTALCGIGVFYVLVRLGRFLHALKRGYPLSRTAEGGLVATEAAGEERSSRVRRVS